MELIKPIFIQKLPNLIKIGGFLIFVFLFTSQYTLFAQGVTPEHVAKTQNVISSLINNNGSLVAYTVSIPADPYKENSSNKTELQILNMESGEAKPYYSNTGFGSIQFRPNHNSITFLTSRPRNTFAL